MYFKDAEGFTIDYNDEPFHMDDHETRGLLDIFSQHNLPVSLKLKECDARFKHFSDILKKVLTGVRIPR